MEFIGLLGSESIVWLEKSPSEQIYKAAMCSMDVLYSVMVFNVMRVKERERGARQKRGDITGTLWHTFPFLRGKLAQSGVGFL